MTVSEIGRLRIETGLSARRAQTADVVSRFHGLTDRFLRHMAVDRVTPSHLEEFRTWLRRQNRSTET